MKNIVEQQSRLFNLFWYSIWSEELPLSLMSSFWHVFVLTIFQKVPKIFKIFFSEFRKASFQSESLAKSQPEVKRKSSLTFNQLHADAILIAEQSSTNGNIPQELCVQGQIRRLSFEFRLWKSYLVFSKSAFSSKASHGILISQNVGFKVKRICWTLAKMFLTRSNFDGTKLQEFSALR